MSREVCRAMRISAGERSTAVAAWQLRNGKAGG
jgi:hypothetical protein